VDGLEFDAEVLYVGALLHDFGLLAEYDLGGCYERDGAVAGQRLALDMGWPPNLADAVREVIELHMAPELPAEIRPETRLLFDSTGVDVTGYRYQEVPPALVTSVVANYPRLEFKTGFSELFEEQARRKPKCRAASMLAAGMLERIASAPFNS